jgi:hypothetical protein
MAKQFDIEKFNKILKINHQKLQAEKITGKKVILSNGLILETEKDVRLCKNRVMSGDNVWKENFDILYSINSDERELAEKKCRSLTSVQGGIKCQEKHGKKIKSNLNTGTPWNKDMKGNYPYSYSHSPETKEKISVANTGAKNGMYGTMMTAEQKEYRSNLMKEKILSGEFTPNSNNRNTHWNSYYRNKKYRSSWESLYQYFDPDAEYETLRIPYVFECKEHIYIVDFVNHKTKTAIEVKPRELFNDQKTQTKISTAEEWCNANGYNLVLADKEYFITRPMPDDLTEFDTKTQNKIRKLYEVNQ